MSFTAYKAGLAEGSGYTRVLITLEIPKDALTNIDRKDILNKQTAKYRTNKTIVRKITDIYGTVYHVAYSLYEKKLAYKVGELVEEPEFDTNMDTVSTKGIHFFLDKECAELYDRQFILNGILKNWHDNGQLASECNYVNGDANGISRGWYENGQLRYECKCIYGKLDGISRGWYENGQLRYDCYYLRGKQYGIQKKCHEND
jgi:antitoxin component YwqK of YwqJK toxin-antitoxin module